MKMNKIKTRVKILKGIEEGKLSYYHIDDYKEDEHEIPWNELTNQIKFLLREGYLIGDYGRSTIVPEYKVEITEKGEKFLEENKIHNKTIKTIKTIKDILK